MGKECDGECEHECLTGCAATFREAMQENRRLKEASRERDLERQMERRPAKSFCVSSLLTAGEALPIEGLYDQVETENWEEYLELIGAGKMTIGMIMKADRQVTIRKELDKQWTIRCETTFKAKSIKGFNVTVPGKVVENKYQPGVPRAELLQDWDLREVESTLEYTEGSHPIQHGNACNCATDCPSTPSIEESRITVTQVTKSDSPHPHDMVLIYSLEPQDQNLLQIQIFKGNRVLATSRLRRHTDPRKISLP